MVEGYIYKLIYEKEKPKKYEMLRLEPLFLDSEKTEMDTGTIISIMSGRSVRFRFVTNDLIPYKRFQGFDPKIFSPKVGERYVVQHWSENPQRAIIYLDKPVK